MGRIERSVSVCKVSIVIPIHNQEGCILDSIRCLQRQTLKEIEIVCVDDASTDATHDILSKVSEQDERIRVITLRENRGTGFARNTGILAARGEYTMFLDADDVYLPTACETLLLLIQRKNVDVLQFGAEVTNVGTISCKTIRYFQKLLDFHFRSGGIGALEQMARSTARIHWVIWNKMVKTELIQEVAREMDDGYMVAGEDMLANVMLFAKLPTYGWTRRRIYKYRCGGGSIRGEIPSLRDFVWKCNRAYCCHALREYVENEQDRLAPGFKMDRAEAMEKTDEMSRRRIRALNRILKDLFYDRMSLTFHQIPYNINGIDSIPYWNEFLAAWGENDCMWFMRRAVNDAALKESLSFRLGAFLLWPVRVLYLACRKILWRSKQNRDNKMKPE